MIRIWKFPDAPASLKKLYPKGSEGTWVMKAPADMSAEAESMLDERRHLFSTVARYPQFDGTVIFFGEYMMLPPNVARSNW
jgi:hypothetical protein